MTNQNNELDEILEEFGYAVVNYPDIPRHELIRKGKQAIQALYAPKPVENGELDLYRALQTLKDQDDNYVLSTISFSSQYGLQRLIEFIEARLAQEKAKWVAEAEKLEHYYSHKAKKEAGYAELYWCACGKYDRDKDRLLRHVRWHELALAKLLDKENV